MAALITIMLLVTLTISGCVTQGADTIRGISSGRESTQVAPDSIVGVSNSTEVREFMLQTGFVDGRMAFVGYGGVIDGIVNPDLIVRAGTSVRVTLISGDDMPHDLSVPELGVKTRLVSNRGDTAELSFTLNEDQEGIYVYFCAVSGHRQAGMEGKLLVQPTVQDVSSADS